MNKNYDLIVEDTRQKLFDALNNSGLQMSSINMLINELQFAVNKQYVEHIQRLRNQIQQANTAEEPLE